MDKVVLEIDVNVIECKNMSVQISSFKEDKTSQLTVRILAEVFVNSNAMLSKTGKLTLVGES